MTREERISGAAVNKLDSDSSRSIKKNNIPKKNNDKKKCCSCGLPFKPNHVKERKAINSKCSNCSQVSHFPKIFHQQKTIKVIKDKCRDGANSDESGKKNEAYQLNIWKIKLSQNVPKFNVLKQYDFMKHLSISNRVVKILIDVGVKVRFAEWRKQCCGLFEIN